MSKQIQKLNEVEQRRLLDADIERMTATELCGDPADKDEISLRQELRKQHKRLATAKTKRLTELGLIRRKP